MVLVTNSHIILKEKGLGSNDLSAKYMSLFLRVFFLKEGKKVNISNQYNQCHTQPRTP